MRVRLWGALCLFQALRAETFVKADERWLTKPAQRVPPMQDVTLEYHPGSFILLRGTVLRGCLSFAQLRPQDPEGGGLLLGQYKEGGHIDISAYTTPQPEDTRRRCFFFPQSRKHSEKAIKAWACSDHTVTWCGEWHTHPEDHPTPSLLDLNQWNENMRNGLPMVAMIIGRKSCWVGITGPEGIIPLERRLLYE